MDALLRDVMHMSREDITAVLNRNVKGPNAGSVPDGFVQTREGGSWRRGCGARNLGALGEALGRLTEQLDSLQGWLGRQMERAERHIAVEMDTGLIVACALTPANQPDALVAESIEADRATQGLIIGTLHIDRGYPGGSVVANVLARHGELVCRPWPAADNNGLFAKSDFDINIKDKIITCPTGQSMPFQLGQTAATIQNLEVIQRVDREFRNTA